MLLLRMLLCLTSPALASEERVRQIIDEMEQLYRGKSSDSIMTMKVETPQYTRTLQMSAQSLGRELALLRILSPKKTAALVH